MTTCDRLREVEATVNDEDGQFLIGLVYSRKSSPLDCKFCHLCGASPSGEHTLQKQNLSRKACGSRVVQNA